MVVYGPSRLAMVASMATFIGPSLDAAMVDCRQSWSATTPCMIAHDRPQSGMGTLVGAFTTSSMAAFMDGSMDAPMVGHERDHESVHYIQ